MEEQDIRMCKETKLCEECKSSPSKYKCPGCSIRSCSLSCVKAHKQRTGCTGKRNQTQFVPISQFDDNLLLSDYNLLEDMKRVAESARRTRRKFGSQFAQLPFHLKGLQMAAKSRKTKLLFLLGGMSKREKNQSQYDNRKKRISWTIEWQFHQTDIVLVDHGVSENASFGSVLENHLKPGPWNHQLRKFCEENLDCLKLFIQKYPKGPKLVARKGKLIRGPKSPFKELDMKAPIKKQLENVAILEFPVIHVFLPSHKVYFEVIKLGSPTIHKPLQNDADGAQSPKAWEEIEEQEEDDDSSPNCPDLDFLEYLDSESSRQMPSQNKSSEQITNITSDNPMLEGGTSGNLSHSSLKSNGLNLPENMTFDLDGNYMDIYSDLMALINPEEFIGYENEHSHKPDDVEVRDLGGVSGICPVPEEELEEGEIAE